VVCAGGLRSPDPELHELVDPFTVLQYEFWGDSAGAGEWRGGMGTAYRFRVDAPAIAAANFGGGNREATAPFGLQGGRPAPSHELRLVKASGEVVEVDAESFYDLGEGDVYEIYESGGGGYGDPRRRPVEKVAADVRDGLVSFEQARQVYGVEVDPQTFTGRRAAG
jgi:N-methylhydantoinase B